MSDSETASSIFTNTATFTSTSTIPGLGATSGKAIKRFGSVFVNAVEFILIRLRISSLEQKKLGKPADYDDLLELSRSVYEPSIQKRAFHVIMGIVGGMEFEALAFAVSQWHLSECYDLLKEMAFCFRLENGPEMTSLPSYIQRENVDTSKEVPLCNAFLLFIALVISFSQTSSFSKLLIHELDILTFITQTFPAIDSSTQDPLLLLPTKLVFRALLEKLDPTVDSPDVPSVGKLKVLLSTTALNSVSLESETDLRASILSPWTRVQLGVNIPLQRPADIVRRLQQICTNADPTKLYKNLVKIRQGASGGIYTAYRAGTNISVAIKKMDLEKQPKKEHHR